MPCDPPPSEEGLPPAKGLEDPAVLDALIHETDAGRVVLVMFERRPWDGGERQLWQLQEKLNAYASFVLDGEFAETHPDLAHLPVCIQLRSMHHPSAEALGFLEQARAQLALMEVDLEIWDAGSSSETELVEGNLGGYTPPMSAHPQVAAKEPAKVELEAGKAYFFCSCGRSANQPFCDGSHKGTEFSPLRFTAEKDGPAWLCQCKHTNNAPFCDGSHKSL